MVADVPVGVLLSGGIDSCLVVALLAEAGQTGLQTFSIGFESAGGESGDEFEYYSSLVAERFGTDHHRIRIDSRRLLPGIDAAIAAMSEPMVSHDCVAFYLLSEEVSAASRSCSPARARTRCSAATTGTRRWPGYRGTTAVEAYAGRVLRPALAGDELAAGARAGWSTTTPRAATSPTGSAGPARRPRWTRRCATTPRSCWSTTR